MNVLFKSSWESSLEREPICEYNRTADCLLGGIVEGLMARGYTEEMARAFLSSKIFRCELDGGLDEHLVNIGKHYGQTIAQTYFNDCERFAKEMV